MTDQTTPTTAPQSTTYYPYDTNGFWTGKTVNSPVAPTSATRFAPPAGGQGMAPWFDGAGWRLVPNYTDAFWTLAAGQDNAQSYLTQAKFRSSDAAKYSPAETATFEAQYQEAQAWTANNTVVGPYLTALSAKLGEDVKTLVSKILAKRDAYSQQSAQFLAGIQAMRDRITQAKTTADLPTYAELRAVARFAV